MQLLHGSMCAAGLCLAVSTSALGDIIYVDADADLMGDGQSWETAYKYLKDALAVAQAPDEIRVAQGTYWPDRSEGDPGSLGDRAATFQLVDGVTLKGGYAGQGEPDPDRREVDPFLTTLTGDLLGDDLPDFVNYGDNSYHVVTADDLVLGATIDGFTIEAGNTEGAGSPNGAGLSCSSSDLLVGACTFRLNRADNGAGAGLYARGSTLTITGSKFLDNRAIGGSLFPSGSGGGAYFAQGTYTVTDGEFERNVAIGSARSVTGMGGALSAQGGFGPVTLERCSFTANEAIGGDYTADGVNGGGGGLWAWQVGLTMTDCTFTDNKASTEFEPAERQYAGYGGAFAMSTTPATITNCRFIRNAAEGVSGGDGFSGFAGGGAFAETTGLFMNCTFIDNTATSYAGGLNIGGAISDPVVRVVNATFTGNEAGEAGGAINVYGVLVEPTVHLANSIVWENVPDEIGVDGTYTLTVDFSDVKDGWAGKGNIDADPRFVDPASGDYRLAADSTCIDAGHNNAVPADSQDLDGDDDYTERVPRDPNGDPRFAVVEGGNDTGCDDPVIVDMGAFEHEGTPVHPVLIGDVDGDQVVDFQDLLEVLSDWGLCDDYCCMADVDFTQQVSFDDLLLVLANWSD